MKNSLFASFIFVIAVSCVSCGKSAEEKNVRAESETASEFEKAADDAPVRIAVGAMTTPKEGFIYYKRLLDYIEKKTGRKVQYINKESYRAINEMLGKGDLDIAFVSGLAYCEGKDEFGLKLLVVPRSYGGDVHYSYVIVPADSDVKDFKELKGKTFAFTDPRSDTGKLVPTYMLAKAGETPDAFFGKYVYTHEDDKSVKAVAMKLVDGAAVDSLIWEYENVKDPSLSAKTRIIHKSRSYGMPLLAAREGLDPEIIRGIKEVLLGMHEDPEGREILKGLMVERFVEGSEGDYVPIRKMKAWLDKWEAEKEPAVAEAGQDQS